jgi:hypothetical protein
MTDRRPHDQRGRNKAPSFPGRGKKGAGRIERSYEAVIGFSTKTDFDFTLLPRRK